MDKVFKTLMPDKIPNYLTVVENCSGFDEVRMSDDFIMACYNSKNSDFSIGEDVELIVFLRDHRFMRKNGVNKYPYYNASMLILNSERELISKCGLLDINGKLVEPETKLYKDIQLNTSDIYMVFVDTVFKMLAENRKN